MQTIEYESPHLPYIVFYLTLEDGIIGVSIVSIFPTYDDAVKWVGNKKGYIIRSLPMRNSAVYRFEFTVKGEIN